MKIPIPLKVTIEGPQGGFKTTLRSMIRTALDHGVRGFEDAAIRQMNANCEIEIVEITTPKPGGVIGAMQAFRDAIDGGQLAPVETYGIPSPPPPQSANLGREAPDLSLQRVFINPNAKAASVPFVRFTTHNGFNIRHDGVKGAWMPTLDAARLDYNAAVERAAKRLRLAGVALLDSIHLGKCDGFIASNEAFARSILPRPTVEIEIKTGAGKFAPLPPAANIERESTPKASGRERALDDLAEMLGGRLSKFPPFLLGALIDGMFDEPAPEQIESHVDPATADVIIGLLKESGMMVDVSQHCPGVMLGKVAIPRCFGDDWVKMIEGMIQQGNALGLHTQLHIKGLVK